MASAAPAAPLAVGDRVKVRGASGLVEGEVLGVGVPDALPVVPGYDLADVQIVSDVLREGGVVLLAVVLYPFRFSDGKTRNVAFVALRLSDGRWFDLRGRWLMLFRYAGADAVSPWEEVR
jgi:hypothetical protein